MLYTLGGTEPSSKLGNVLLDDLLGATIHWTHERAPYQTSLDDLFRQLIDGGKSPHVVPYGGSSRIGLMAYVGAILEVAEQESNTEPFDTVIFASSTGGTQARMILGAHLEGWLSRVRLLVLSVDEPDTSRRV